MQSFLMTLLVLLAGFGIYFIVMFFYQKRIIKTLKEVDFRAGYRKAQLIDLREQNEYKAGHILGARNIPLGQLKMYTPGLRSDQPVYLYCLNGTRCVQAARVLRKAGIKDLYMLEGGFKQWTGKVKSK
ncbi:MAG: rhodanese-like domain-containing protein [Bacillaceae bacterium]